jgi:hypothetical protein
MHRAIFVTFYALGNVVEGVAKADEKDGGVKFWPGDPEFPDPKR